MADFNLVPVPRVLLVQAGIFIANTIIIKKLLIEPYLKLKAKRDSIILNASKLRQQRALLHWRRSWQSCGHSDVAGSVHLAQLRRKKYEQARARREELIVTATHESEAAIKEAKAGLRKEFEAAQVDLDSTVGNLSQEMFDLLLPLNGEQHARR